VATSEQPSSQFQAADREERFMGTAIDQQVKTVLYQPLKDKDLARFVNPDLAIPAAYCGTGEIKLILLGQDPTIKNKDGQARITTVINLRGYGPLWNYVARICKGLHLDLHQNIHATNCFKNFFVKPATQITEVNIFEKFARWWLPVLQDEIDQFRQVPIIALGQPLLSVLVNDRGDPLVRDYWGYTPNWKTGERRPYRFLEPDKNHLGRLIFPFPHQPSIRKQFYAEQMAGYISFVKRILQRA